MAAKAGAESTLAAELFSHFWMKEFQRDLADQL
jgi:hypothetical protein